MELNDFISNQNPPDQENYRVNSEKKRSLA